MDKPYYEFEAAGDSHLFSFLSRGPRGTILKMVQFSPMTGRLYNVGFGDWDEDTNEINDITVSDNGDMDMVLSTVVEVTRYFLSSNPGVSVFLTGSSPSRTRLYQIIINKYWEQIESEFEVRGYLNGQWRNFEKNVKFESFMVSKLF